MEPARRVPYYSGQKKIIKIQSKGAVAGPHFNIETQLDLRQFVPHQLWTQSYHQMSTTGHLCSSWHRLCLKIDR